MEQAVWAPSFLTVSGTALVRDLGLWDCCHIQFLPVLTFSFRVWIRRNESLIGVKRLKCKDNVFCKKTPKSPKKFKAIVIEIGRVSFLKMCFNN